jgi:cystathionine beta-lyase
VRLTQHESSALLIARWFATQPSIEQVLHPALPSCPGHRHWARDFTGSSSTFSVVFSQGVPQQAILEFVDRLELFKIGYSWGGVTSLAMPFFALRRREHRTNDNLVRFNVGLEDPHDLMADLNRSLSQIQA